MEHYAFSDYFDIEELQKIQDLFSDATGVASMITEPDGTPITQPSGFCGLCNEIRKTEKGFIHCKRSDSIIGKTNEKGPNIHNCYSAGFLEAGASIIVEGKHIANWLVGQILEVDQPIKALRSYAGDIGLPEEIFEHELSHVKRMTKSQFVSISNFLYENAQMISRYATNNIVLSRELDQKNRHEAEIGKLNTELKRAQGSIIKTVIHTLHEKSPREEKHSQRVSNISQSIGKALQLPELELNKLKAVGLLHDIGKIGVEGSILDKVENLTQKEYDEIKKHPDIGYRILSSSADMKELAEITLSHHERWDGKGYPNGLKGEEIPILSRIVSIADSYDAMTSDRPYRKALTKEETIQRILENAGTQFDEQIAEIFIEVVVPTLQN